MDYAREPATHPGHRRPAAEPNTAQGAVAQAMDLRRGGVVQREAGPEEELQMKAAGPLQRQAGPEEELQMMRAPGVAQREAGPEEELQMKAAPTAAPSEAAPRSGGAAPLPAGLQAGVEQLSGLAMDEVNVHYGSSQPAQLNALAFAKGTDIHLAPGQETHLPHEAWHVVQQAQGRVAPTLHTPDGVAINDDPGLEQEADVMGARALTLGG